MWPDIIIFAEKVCISTFNDSVSKCGDSNPDSIAGCLSSQHLLWQTFLIYFLFNHRATVGTAHDFYDLINDEGKA